MEETSPDMYRVKELDPEFPSVIESWLNEAARDGYEIDRVETRQVEYRGKEELRMLFIMKLRTKFVRPYLPSKLELLSSVGACPLW